MDIKLALDNIHDLIHNMKNQDRETRLLSYSVITVIINDLKHKAEENSIPNQQYFVDLKWSIESLCGLDSGNNLGDEKHLVYALSAIEKLKSIHCFNVR